MKIIHLLMIFYKILLPMRPTPRKAPHRRESPKEVTPFFTAEKQNTLSERPPFFAKEGNASSAVSIGRKAQPLIQRAKTWGTEKTTAPVAKNPSPPKEFLSELSNEVRLFQLSEVIIKWIKGTFTKKAGTQKTDFKPADLFADKQLVKKLNSIIRSLKSKSVIKRVEDLKAILDLMVHYGVLQAPTPPAGGGAWETTTYSVLTDQKTGMVATEAISSAGKKIKSFTKEFAKKVGKKNSLAPTVETDLLPMDMASGKTQQKQEKKLEAKLANIEKQFDEFIIYLGPTPKKKSRKRILRATEQPKLVEEKNGVEFFEVTLAVKGNKKRRFRGPIEKAELVRTGTKEETVKYREGLDREKAKVEAKLVKARGYRTLAKVNVEFMKKLRGENSNWSAGTYRGHSWGEFSIDVFLRGNGPKDKDGNFFYDYNKTIDFFKALNKVAEAGTASVKKFSWRAIYNDPKVKREINKLFGARRILSATNHGPGPDHKLHIHLDLRPEELKKDKVTGFKIENGRIKLLDAKP